MTVPRSWWSVLLGAVLFLWGCSERAERTADNLDVNPSTYVRKAAAPVLFDNVTVLDGIGGEMPGHDVLVKGGRIVAIGTDLELPVGAARVDGNGRFLTPGIIDVHTHYGTASLPYAQSHSDVWDVNEATDPITPDIRIEHAISPQDPAIAAARRAGVTTFQVMPGSRNLIAGLTVVLKNVDAATPQAMKFPGAPYALKMACGENPKAYGSEGKEPYSRMGNVALQRKAWAEAGAYRKSTPDTRDMGLEVLVAALEGALDIHVHCYRADDMATLLDMAREFGFKIAAFHHAVEAYKIADLFKETDTCGVVWSDWWGWKLEAYDGIPQNAAFLQASGACVVLHSDISALGTLLNVEAAKALASGRAAGLDISEGDALAWITSAPAKLLGIDDRVGSIEVGKMADLVLWSGHPLSIYSKTEQVLIDGVTVYDREKTPARTSDMVLGQRVREDVGD